MAKRKKDRQNYRCDKCGDVRVGERAIITHIFKAHGKRKAQAKYRPTKAQAAGKRAAAQREPRRAVDVAAPGAQIITVPVNLRIAVTMLGVGPSDE